jgi:hypothetical protein
MVTSDWAGAEKNELAGEWSPTTPFGRATTKSRVVT